MRHINANFCFPLLLVNNNILTSSGYGGRGGRGYYNSSRDSATSEYESSRGRGGGRGYVPGGR